MRKVEVPVYKFDELSEEVQEALKEGSKAEGISEAVKDFIEERLVQYGLKSIMVDDFSINADDEDDYIKISGALTDALKMWEDDEDFSELVSDISFCLLDEEDANEDTNPFGICVGGDGMSDDNKSDAKEFIEEQLENICAKVISETVGAMDTFEADEEKVLEYLNQYEFLADGTAFSEEEYVK
jgi:hypothetical protein